MLQFVPSVQRFIDSRMKYFFLTAALLVLFVQPSQAMSDNDPLPVDVASIAMVPSSSIPVEAPAPVKSGVLHENPSKSPQTIVFAYITGYNTTADQTDGTPCIAAGGNICGRKDAVACPPTLALRSWVVIGGKKYQCMDRTAEKFKHRFDISCDKDMQCPAEVTGWKDVVIQ